ncbi:hypothetical protein [Cupriavidus sp. D384]|uniref:hypothetical protein n=1 Tax=Cupriavidus sp. D384 TaxID=1538095 RepID=UPI0008368944|nr:hypothetical protein [Cupriavidus sp. D384]
MTLLDPRLWGAALLVLAVGCGSSYMAGRSDGRKLENQARQAEIDQWKDNADVAYSLYLEARDKKEVRYRTITKTIEVAKNATPDIPDCRTGDDWMRIYRDNAAIANSAGVPTGSGGADGADAGRPQAVRP